MTVLEGVPDHLKGRFEALLRLQPAGPPDPWHHIVSLPIGGLTGVGFDENSEYLLVVSHDGLGLVDCHSGDLVARDKGCADSVDPGTLVINGIGPTTGKLIHISGVLGGGLPNSASGGWTVDELSVSWSDSAQFLIFGEQSLTWPENDRLVNIFRLPECESRPLALGFSPNGRILVVACSSSVILYANC